MKLHRLICLILALLLVFSFSGCSGNDKDNSDGTFSSSSSDDSKKNNNNKKDNKENVIENVFKPEYTPLEGNFDSIYNMEYFQDKLYFYTYIYTEEKSGMAMFEMNIDGSEIREIPLNVSENSSINDFLITIDGNIMYNEAEYIYTEETYEEKFALKLIDPNGTVLKDIDLNTFKSDNPDEYFYINSMTSDNDGNIYLCANQRIIILNSDGAKLSEIESDKSLSNLFKVKDGSILVMAYTENGQKFYKIDLETHELGEEFAVENLNYNYSLMQGSDKYDLYLSNTTSIFGYNFEDDSLVELINWINSDIDTDSINMTIPLPDGRFVSYSYDWESNKKELITLTEVPADQIPERTILTLSTPYLDYDVRKAVINFNKTNEKYRIQIKDYSTYATHEDYNAGTTRFNTDLMAGNIPDIIVADNGINFNNYISKGILLDLYTLIDADEELSRETFVPSVLKACETDGKLYMFTPSFSIQTFAAKTSLVGPEMGWTMQDMKALQSSKPEAEIFTEMTKNDVLRRSLNCSINQFVDKSTGKCSFNSQGFIDLLEFCNTFPDEIDFEKKYGPDFDWEEYNLYYESMYIKDNVLLMNTYLSDFRALRRIEKVQFGEPITFIGFPSSNEQGSVFNPTQIFTITSKSKNVEGAWEFLKHFMSYEYQSEQYLFPTRMDALKEKAANEMKPNTYEDENGNLVEMENTYYLSTGDEINVGYPDQADIDKTMALIDSITSFYTIDEKLNAIVEEESAAFFAGQKTASAVADLIQNKVSIYIAESR